MMCWQGSAHQNCLHVALQHLPELHVRMHTERVEIEPHRPFEDRGLLGNDANRAAVRQERQLANVVAVEADGPRAQRRRDDGEDVESDDEDEDALVVGEVVAVLAQTDSGASVPQAYAQLPIVTERQHRIWGE